jgi:hypothetical protein
VPCMHAACGRLYRSARALIDAQWQCLFLHISNLA